MLGIGLDVEANRNKTYTAGTSDSKDVEKNKQSYTNGGAIHVGTLGVESNSETEDPVGGGKSSGEASQERKVITGPLAHVTKTDQNGNVTYSGTEITVFSSSFGLGIFGAEFSLKVNLPSVNMTQVPLTSINPENASDATKLVKTFTTWP